MVTGDRYRPMTAAAVFLVAAIAVAAIAAVVPHSHIRERRPTQGQLPKRTDSSGL